MDAATFRRLGRVHGVGVVFENVDGEVLVLRRHPEVHQGRRYGLVGGRIEDGESAVEAAVRETLEETGMVVRAEGLEYVKAFESDFPEGHITFEVYRAKHPFNGEVILDPREHTGHLWAPPSELRARGDLHDGVTEILDHIFF